MERADRVSDVTYVFSQFAAYAFKILSIEYVAYHRIEKKLCPKTVLLYN